MLYSYYQILGNITKFWANYNGLEHSAKRAPVTMTYANPTIVLGLQRLQSQTAPHSAETRGHY